MDKCGIEIDCSKCTSAEHEYADHLTYPATYQVNLKLPITANSTPVEGFEDSRDEEVPFGRLGI